jgi:poly(hydroxyalkanoate) granule-associated protein
MRYLTQLETVARTLPANVMEFGHQVWLAGLGAVGMMSHTTATMFDTLVDEGTRFQKQQTKAVDKMVTTTKQTVTEAFDEAVERVQTNVQHAAKVALNRLGMPSRGDVAHLTARVDKLTTKLEALGRRGVAHVK